MSIKKLEKNNKFKKVASLLGISFVLMGTLTGCRNQNEHYNQTDKIINVTCADFSDEDLKNLPSTIEEVYFKYCSYITDLSALSKSCPNIKILVLDSCSSVTDLSFIYSLPNLERVVLNDMADVTPELVDYFENNDIDYEVSDRDILAYEKAKQIIDEIITDDMSDEEKVKAISLYVYENCKYKLSSKDDSNLNPFETTLLDGKGVCMGYAYTTNILFRMAGIDSYQIFNSNHTWNMVYLDDKYYYLDVTNLHGCVTKKIAIFLMKKYNISSGCYLTDPGANLFSAMTDFDDKDLNIPDELLEDIYNGEEKKTLIEKYGNCLSVRVIELVISLFVVMSLSINLVKKGKNMIDTHSYEKRLKMRKTLMERNASITNYGTNSFDNYGSTTSNHSTNPFR